MKSIITLLTVFLSSAAFADGFVCTNEEQDLRIQVYNHINAEDGTRSASTLVLSNPQLQKGNRTIARFTESNGTLANSGAIYIATVDLRYKDSSRKGELIAGTKLGELKSIALAIDFSYSEPLPNGTLVLGQVTLTKRNGHNIPFVVSCRRYLKN